MIYTRTGDKGQTSLFNGQRVSKSDLRVEAYGTVDELSSAIGLVVAEVSFPRKRESKIPDQVGDDGFKNELIKVQNDLFEIGSCLANPENGKWKMPARQRVRSQAKSGGENGKLENRAKEFENSIDKMTEKMPPLSNFILPGGGKTGALLHLARTVCRRAERKVVALDEREKVDKNIVMYLNRLSDLLFTMARFVNYKEGYKETIWVKS